ncbi:hypothetical protein GOBAR_AA04712 [Gossypium barbadense]|uniref:Uncharacterized protein n=1 Tax=Gossypium barbadense TaxID=3634 RepID=A0A2P5YJX5_GOSBA|nr:hypothetical protein GOBAR_AA04712 [Gossypium barbadense]
MKREEEIKERRVECWSSEVRRRMVAGMEKRPRSCKPRFGPHGCGPRPCGVVFGRVFCEILVSIAHSPFDMPVSPGRVVPTATLHDRVLIRSLLPHPCSVHHARVHDLCLWFDDLSQHRTQPVGTPTRPWHQPVFYSDFVERFNLWTSSHTTSSKPVAVLPQFGTRPCPLAVWYAQPHRTAVAIYRSPCVTLSWEKCLSYFSTAMTTPVSPARGDPTA